ncbi:MAG: Uma2 family endonuclease [Chloroflexi bacterium]|nr:Uma2 family endonuclease [Chloroflexota bacterium]
MTMVADPREQRLTLEDYLALPEDEDREREIVHGMLYVTPKPAKEHQWLMMRLSRLLAESVARHGGDDRQVLPDADLIIDARGTYVSPDLMYFEPAELQHLLSSPRGWVDVTRSRPTLVVEIVSQSTTTRDVVEKLQDYEAAGIPHYWVFGPERRRFREFVLDQTTGRYRLNVDARGGRGTPALFAPSELVLDLDTLF